MQTNSQGNRRKNTLVLMTALIIAAAPLGYRFLNPWLADQRTQIVSWDCFSTSLITPIGSALDGTIVEMSVVPGQTVLAGELIGRMDSSQLDQQLIELQAQKAVAIERLNVHSIRLEAERRSMKSAEAVFLSKILVARKSIEWRQAGLRWLSRELERARQLNKLSTVPQSELEELFSDRDKLNALVELEHEKQKVAEAELAQHKARGKQLEILEAELAVLQKQVRVAELKIETLKTQLAKCFLVAHQDGIITQIQFGAGASVRVGDEVLFIESDRRWCECWIDETDLPVIPHLAHAEIRFHAFPDMVVEGTVVSSLPDENPAGPSRRSSLFHSTRKLKLLIELENQNELKVAAGMTAKVTIDRTTAREGIDRSDDKNRMTQLQ